MMADRQPPREPEVGRGPIRLVKIMADRALCSRREAERLIAAGSVRVDGRVIDQQGVKVDSEARIEIVGIGERWLADKVTVLLHKPLGIVSTQPEGDQVPAWRLLTRERLYGATDPAVVRRICREPWHLSVAGRLDQDSRGLLLLTSDGVLARRVTGGHEWTKVYRVTVDRPVSDLALERLNSPRRLDDKPLLAMSVRRLGERLLRFELREGRKHQIRRVCREEKLTVKDLLRLSIGPFTLGDLPEGRWRVVAANETTPRFGLTQHLTA